MDSRPAASMAQDWFPGMPTGALVAQMELLSQTLAFRAQHPVMDAQQVLAAQLQYYQAPPGPFHDAQTNRVYWRACGRANCPCRYWVVEGLDAPDAATVRPDIDPLALHLSALRKKRHAALIDVGAMLRERNIPYTRIEGGPSGYADVFFEAHGDAVAAFAHFTEQKLNVNFKRKLHKDGKSRKNGHKE